MAIKLWLPPFIIGEAKHGKFDFFIEKKEKERDRL